ncbi:hypothetical protein GCM10007890_01500 [Methylobacterium tardum]|uniref:Uncharacterized protein n=1 Tax=Methylobacterium tardum TaxID=374432 RepID=A0AA37TBI7_9HYPH|nr:hypothetical protein GCM10007890_01500 [Methylobacterium tardum]
MQEREVQLGMVFLDGTNIRAHQKAAGAAKRGDLGPSETLVRLLGRWFITRLAHAGISPKAIMMLAGHRHLSTTQRDIDVNDEMMRAAVEVL